LHNAERPSRYVKVVRKKERERYQETEKYNEAEGHRKVETRPVCFASGYDASELFAKASY
jgi:hypothetical protein